jgi:predicted TIM-barrel fold metal-dependent hydrolase
MILDGHIHIYGDSRDWASFAGALKKTGFDGGIVFSRPPKVHEIHGGSASCEERLEQLVDLSSSLENIFPFYWLDPSEKDAIEQVDIALNYGVAGFKFICGHFYPNEKFAMEVFAKIASVGKPMVFHTGILGDAANSSKYCRPLEYECLVEIENAKFSLAHISYPWSDEVIALFGKINGARKHYGLTAEMFVDTTPGTPGLYRKEALTKCFVYPMEEHLIFGSDSNTADFLVDYSKSIVDDDIAIFKELGKSDEVIDNVFHKNLLRFVEAREI